MSKTDQDDALLHYGILGMRWGVRKDRRTGKRVGTPVKGTKAAKRDQPSVSPKPGSSSKPSAQSKNAITKESNEELRLKVERIKLEQEYKRLKSSPPAKKSALRRETEAVLKNVAKRQVEHLLNSAIQSKSNEFLKKYGIQPAGGKKKKRR